MDEKSEISLEKLRRSAKRLGKAFAQGSDEAKLRLRMHPPKASKKAPQHSDFLHVIAHEKGFANWPSLKFAAESQGFSHAQKQQRLKIALYHGQNWIVEKLLNDTPDLARGILGLEIAIYDLDAVKLAAANDARFAAKHLGPRRPILHLAFSKYIHLRPELSENMLEIAQILMAHGADVNDTMPASPDDPAPLSALYGALGHAGNLSLARFLLERGANPNDGESLYHATELGHTDGVKLLLEHGARPEGTNAVLRAMDFNDHEMVRMMLAGGAKSRLDPVVYPSNQPIETEPALHHAARRGCDSEMVHILLNHGAEKRAVFSGRSAATLSRIYGNHVTASGLIFEGDDITNFDALFIRAAENKLPVDDHFLDDIPMIGIETLLVDLVPLPAKLPHIKRLVSSGLDPNKSDNMGVTPAQAAGWQGLPETLAYFLEVGIDIKHMNDFAGICFRRLSTGQRIAQIATIGTMLNVRDWR